MDNIMNVAVNNLIEAIKRDYAATHERLGVDDDEKRRQVRIEMMEEFNNSFEVSEGKKYIKIIREGSVWGFVVNTNDDKKFAKGDILMPAGASTPARNAARGNVFDGYEVEWTGPKYLK